MVEIDEETLAILNMGTIFTKPEGQPVSESIIETTMEQSSPDSCDTTPGVPCGDDKPLVEAEEGAVDIQVNPNAATDESTLTPPSDASTPTSTDDSKTPSDPSVASTPEEDNNDEDDIQIVKYVNRQEPIIKMQNAVVLKIGSGNLDPSISVDSVHRAIQRVDRCLEINIMERKHLLIWRKNLQEKAKLYEEVRDLIGPKSTGTATTGGGGVTTTINERPLDMASQSQTPTPLTNLLFNIHSPTLAQNGGIKPPPMQAHHKFYEMLSSKQTPEKRENGQTGQRTNKPLTPPPKVVLNYRSPATPFPIVPPPPIYTNQLPSTPNANSYISSMISPISGAQSSPYHPYVPRPPTESEQKILGILKHHAESIQNMGQPAQYRFPPPQNFTPLHYPTKAKPPTPPTKTPPRSRKIKKKDYENAFTHIQSILNMNSAQEGGDPGSSGGSISAKKSRLSDSRGPVSFEIHQDSPSGPVTFTRTTSSETNRIDQPPTEGFPAPEVEVFNICEKCRKVKANFMCAACTNRWYCSRECQMADWTAHSYQCDGPAD